MKCKFAFRASLITKYTLQLQVRHTGVGAGRLHAVHQGEGCDKLRRIEDAAGAGKGYNTIHKHFIHSFLRAFQLTICLSNYDPHKPYDKWLDLAPPLSKT